MESSFNMFIINDRKLTIFTCSNKGLTNKKKSHNLPTLYFLFCYANIRFFALGDGYKDSQTKGLIYNLIEGSEKLLLYFDK